jgi:hypothetical protein
MEVKNAQSTIYKTVPISLAKGAIVNHLIVIERIYGKYATPASRGRNNSEDTANRTR